MNRERRLGSYRLWLKGDPVLMLIEAYLILILALLRRNYDFILPLFSSDCLFNCWCSGHEALLGHAIPKPHLEDKTYVKKMCVKESFFCLVAIRNMTFHASTHQRQGTSATWGTSINPWSSLVCSQWRWAKPPLGLPGSLTICAGAKYTQLMPVWERGLRQCIVIHHTTLFLLPAPFSFNFFQDSNHIFDICFIW